MNAIGPVEADADTTHPWEPPPHSRRTGRRVTPRRRAALGAAAALTALAAGAAHLYASRPDRPPAPPPPYPAQAVHLVYAAPVAEPRRTPVDGFRFAVVLRVRAGPPVTVTRIGQPSPGLAVTSAPAAPFQTKRHSDRKIIVTLRVTDCDKAPRNPGFPFLDVTLRNTRAIQAHSFILGARYAKDLSEAIGVACGNDSA